MSKPKSMNKKENKLTERDKNKWVKPPKLHKGFKYENFLNTFGTADPDLVNYFFNQLMETYTFSDEERIKKYNTHLSVLNGIKPKDELEGMLAVQMVAAHNLAMKYLSNAGLKGQTFEGVDANVNRATKLLRVFATQIEALNRHRGGSQQKVVVEHVHVHKGGQAVVGSVVGGGGNAKK